MTTTIPYPIDEPLPAEVAASGGRILRFQRYPVFGWPWYWRRLALVLPLILLAAYATGTEHAAFAHDSDEGFAVSWRVAVAYLLLVGGGQLFAVVIRHARLSQSKEYALLVFAILIGMFAADVAGRWAEDFHDALMQAHRQTMMQFPVGIQSKDSFAETLWQVVRNVAVYFFCAGGWDLRTYWNQQERWRTFGQQQQLQALQNEKQRVDMRLAVLQAQVEPHFLFNTMASVRSLVRSDPQRAEATISALVDHLRATLPKLRNTDAGATTLGEQLDICRSYLEVMRVRTGERLNYSIQVPRELEASSFPPLMLISLVENAVKHGAEPKPGPCTIEITAQQIETDGGRSLQVSVSDDGMGLQVGAGNGVGLANIRDQLATRFGERASFQLVGRERSGVVATICVPVEVPGEG